jgi:hypothetical protein
MHPRSAGTWLRSCNYSAASMWLHSPTRRVSASSPPSSAAAPSLVCSSVSYLDHSHLNVAVSLSLISPWRDVPPSTAIIVSTLQCLHGEKGDKCSPPFTSEAYATGTLTIDALSNTDRDGVTIAAAMASSRGFDGLESSLMALALPGSIAEYVEVHIEQGPALEEMGEPVGVVTSIAGQSRLRLEVVGKQGHAGAAPCARIDCTGAA